MKTRPRMRMKRLLLLLLAYAVGGTIINVAVAWGSAAKPRQVRQFNNEFLRSHPDDPTWYFLPLPGKQRLLVSSFPFADVGWKYLPGRTLDWSIAAERPLSPSSFDDPSHKITFFVEAASGWPLLSMRACVELGEDMKSIEKTHGAFVVNGATSFVVDGRALPLRPLWPGFAINTILYAAILWLLFAAPGFVRRRRRGRRGQCPACAYPVGSSTVCTECGRPVTPRA
jgi:hypothetical protein